MANSSNSKELFSAGEGRDGASASPSHPLHLFRYCPLCGSSQFVENNEKSKRCLECGFVYYLNPSAATVAVITNENGELLAVRRAKEPARGTLDLPGGFSDCYETSEQGVVREVKEETGLDVDRVEFLFSIPNLYEFSGFTVHTIDMFYRCYVKAGNMTKAHAADDAADIIWLRPENINPAEFGLKSISKGVERIKEVMMNDE